MSFDIEASSSHGDFPLARKTYRKPMKTYTKPIQPIETL